jgi:hypothetical protein
MRLEAASTTFWDKFLVFFIDCSTIQAVSAAKENSQWRQPLELRHFFLGSPEGAV